MSKVISEEIKNNVVRFYKTKPMTIQSVADKFELSKPTVSKILKEKNCEIYKKAQVYNPEMKEDYFETIDTEYKAYFLGYLITDGCVHEPIDGRQSSISLSIKSEDDYILYKLKEEIKLNTDVVKDKRGCSTIAMRSDKIASDLKKFGIVPNKTELTFFPILDKKDLMPHLIRGMIDGDGCVRSTVNKHNKHVHVIDICGTPEVVKGMIDFIYDELNINSSKIYHYTETFCQSKWQNINSFFTLGDYIYKNSHIHLERKRNAFIDFLNHYNIDYNFANTEITDEIKESSAS